MPRFLGFQDGFCSCQVPLGSWSVVMIGFPTQDPSTQAPRELWNLKNLRNMSQWEQIKTLITRDQVFQGYLLHIVSDPV